MKQITHLFLVLIFMSSISGCSGDDNNGNPQEEEGYYIKAKVNGQLEVASKSAISVFSDGTLVLLSYLTDDSTEYFSIRIGNYNGSGTYTIGTGSNNVISLFNITKLPNNFILSGYDENVEAYLGNITVNIQESGNLLTGTFSGNAVNQATNEQVSITSGEFKIIKTF